MIAREVRLFFLVVMAAGTSATSRAGAVPEVKLDVPADFAHSLSVQHFQKGEDVLHIDWQPTPTQAALTRYQGWWYPDGSRANTDHGWTIDVFSAHSQKVAEAYEHASNGYVADLDEMMDFFTVPRATSLFESPRRALSYLFARFQRKSFRWGHAVSFFSQGVQDTSMPEPANGRLSYEIFGVTKDGRYTVVASLLPSHPKLPNDRDAKDMRADVPDNDAQSTKYLDAQNRRDFSLADAIRGEMHQREEAALGKEPGVKLIESARPDEFQPSLAAFDHLVDSLSVR
jgi:hypothetical protein